MPGRSTSPVYTAAPVVFSAPSTRGTERPATFKIRFRCTNVTFRCGAPLFTNLRAVFFRKVRVAERAVEINSRAQHVRIGDEDFLTVRTGDFDRLPHDSLLRPVGGAVRSEERRVGKECRSRWS